MVLSSRAVLKTLFCVLVVPSVGYAEPTPGDGMAWLQRIATASRKTNFSGTFVYSSGARTETSRVTHLVEGGTSKERLEVLDGSPREVVRINEEVRCFLPSERKVIVDRLAAPASVIPTRVPESFSKLGDYYRVRKGEVTRVAGMDAQTIVLEPLDGFRYGHVLWAEVSSGLLLKSRMFDEKNETIEQLVFSDISIGAVDKSRVKPRFASTPSDWKIVHSRSAESGHEDINWVFATVPPGYWQSAVFSRSMAAVKGELAHQVVFTDGLAAISVFIEPAVNRPEKLGVSMASPFNVYRRIQGDRLITLIGEVPVAALKRLGDGLEPKTRQ